MFRYPGYQVPTQGTAVPERGPMSTNLTVPELANWLAEQTWSDFAQSLARYFRQHGRLSEAQEGSARRMYAKCAQRQAQRQAQPVARPAQPTVTPGFYLVGDILYKVVKAKSHDGVYASRRGENGGWVYDRGAIRTITADQQVTPEQAVAHGLRTGICLFCNAELDDRDGLGRIVGVGPVCARRHLGLTQRQLANRMAIAIPAGVSEVAE
jgi:hypothetical protein